MVTFPQTSVSSNAHSSVSHDLLDRRNSTEKGTVGGGQGENQRLTSALERASNSVTTVTFSSSQNGVQVVNQLTVAQNHTFLTSGVEKYQSLSGLEKPGSAALRILNFIENRLLADQAEGDSPEQLQSRLEAGLEGFLKGYGEALEQLKATGMFTAEVEAAVGGTYNEMLQGVVQLADKFGLQKPVVDGVDLENISEPINNAPDPDLSGSAANVRASSPARPTIREERLELTGQALATNAFSFKLRTADGDTVTIKALSGQASSFGYGLSAYSAQQAQYQHQGFSSVFTQAQQFGFSVEGELDADELKAINDLLGQVNNVSDTFFSGDIYGAFDKALEVGFNRDEIAGFSLNLRMTEYTQAAATYNRIADNVNSESNVFNRNSSAMTQVAEFVQLLEEARLSAEKLGLDLLALVDMHDFVAQNKFSGQDNLQQFKPLVLDTLRSLEELQS